MSQSKEELVAQLNEIYRTLLSALLNRKYYGHRLSTYRSWDKVMEIALAIAAASSVGTWAIWQSGYGRSVWAVIAGGAVVLAVVKPFLQLPNEIERYSKLHAGYSDLYYDLDRLVSEIAVQKDVTPEVLTLFRSTQERVRFLLRRRS